VAYDQRLADRILRPPEPEPLLTEQRMFPGLAFLIGGNIAVAASGQRGALIRVDPCQVGTPTAAAEPMLMCGRAMGADGSILTPNTCAETGREFKATRRRQRDHARDRTPHGRARPAGAV
jgi:hypothetical protein